MSYIKVDIRNDDSLSSKISQTFYHAYSPLECFMVCTLGRPCAHQVRSDYNDSPYHWQSFLMSSSPLFLTFSKYMQSGSNCCSNGFRLLQQQLLPICFIIPVSIYATLKMSSVQSNYRWMPRLVLQYFSRSLFLSARAIECLC